MGLFDLFKPDVGKLQQQRDIQGLMTALEHKDSQIRAHAAYSLGELKALSAVDVLIKHLREDTTDVKRESALALGNIKNQKAIPVLIETFTYGINWDPHYGTTDAYMNPVAVSGGLRDTYVSIHNNAKWALLQIGVPALPALVNTLSDKSPYARLHACNIIGNMKEKTLVGSIAKLLEDPFHFVRHSAAWSLGSIGDTASLNTLKIAYQKESDERVKKEISQAIESIEKKGT
jgi:HEAT repeat protein